MRKIPSANQLSDIVWLQTAFIGDIVLTTGAINLVRKEFPHIRQHIITTPEGWELLKGMPALETRLVYAKSRTGLMGFSKIRTALRELSLEKASTLIIQPHRSVRSSLLCRFLGFPTLTYTESSFSFLATQTIPRISVFHEVQRIALLLEPLGVERETVLAARPLLQALPLVPDVPWQRELANFTGELVGLAVGTQWGTKRWPLESYTELAKRLGARPKTGLVLIGSKGEKGWADSLASALQRSSNVPLWNLAGLTSFDDLRRLFPRLSLLISNDSSPVHFASAFHVRSLVVFGSTTPSLGFGPLAKHSQVVEHSLSCRPCSDHGPQLCPLGHFACMKNISVEKMTQRALAVL
ncbi:MAG: glycosyltransferase family 9 protein [Deltaproteobacteria bacterium]|nr:glycosyltransferase family 9 protein [Deltaproteobacteria bacterium]